MAPATRYARSGEIHIAYQVVGEGPIDLLFVPSWISQVEHYWEEPVVARYFNRMASFSRLIMFDRRGSGLSDPVLAPPTLEEQMDDVVAVWTELLKTRNPTTMALGGTSAGGNLTLAAALRLKDLGLPLPAAIMLGTPAVDMNKTGDSRFLNDGVDHGLAWDGVAAEAVKIYANGHDYSDPYLSPIHGDVSGFPPTYLVTGTRDLLLSDTVLMHAKLRRAGVHADLHVYEGFAHADYLRFYGTPESEQHFAELKQFLHDNLGH